ncbi:MAG: low-complexity tail membrane protein [Synechococcaceae cyanobacterium]|nr:low-complexity tail membrane protein [Synechococcaceae cyanobacterium]
MASSAPAAPRTEPLLWCQLLGIGALPLEGLLLLLLLAGSDPGPWPWLERALVWSLGVLAPAVLLWNRPADVWSLLLLSTPQRGRRDLQRRLSALQGSLPLRLALLLGAAGLLPLLSWLDRWSVLASSLALLPDSPRLVALLLSVGVLAVMLWQWQQLLQAVWLLSRPARVIAATPPLSGESLAAGRLCLGLPLLLPDPLRFATAEPAPAAAAPEPARAQASSAELPPQPRDNLAPPPGEAPVQAMPEPSGEPRAEGAPPLPAPPTAAGAPPAAPNVSEPEALLTEAHEPEGSVLEALTGGAAESGAAAGSNGPGLAVPIDDEQQHADNHSPELDQQVGPGDGLPG